MIINSKHVGGGADPVINPLTVTENGTYTAPSGVDGYSPVTVNVAGGGSIFHESGTLDIHTGTNRTSVNIPISNTSLSHYLIVAKATNSWVKENDVWVKRDSIDFTGLTASEFPAVAVTNVHPQTTSNGWTTANGTGKTGVTIDNVNLIRAGVSATTSAGEGGIVAITIGADYIRMSSSNRLLCGATWGLSFDFDVWGWD